MSERVPEGWAKLKLGNIGTFSTSSVDKKVKDDETSVSLLNYMDIYRNSVLSSSFPFQLVTAPAKQVTSSSVRNGDVFFTPSSETPDDIGHSAVFLGDADNLVHSYHTIRFRPGVDNHFDDNYKAYAFKGEETYEYFRKRATGSTRFTVSLPIFNELEVLIPPLNEQKKIASILTSVDEVIETTQKQIEKLQDLKKATMNELLTKGIGHTEFKDSELGRIPKSWEVRTIRELITKVVDNRGKTPPLSSEGRELIELASILKSQRFLDYKRSKKRVSENTYKTWFRNGHPQIGDILVPTVGLIGECSIVSENRGCIAQNVIALRCSDNLLGDYLYWLMYSEYVLSEIKRVLMGAVQPSLKVPHLLDTRIPLPPTDEQIKILETLNTIENAVIDNQKKVASFQSLKKSLMQDLLTGKVRVQVN